MINYNKQIKVNNSLTCGYQTFCDSKHPLVNGSGWIYYHRHIASIKIGRWLTKVDHVHHKDQNRLNNSPDNLEVLVQSDHARIHCPALIRTRILICPICKTVQTNKRSKYKIYCSEFCRNTALGFQTENVQSCTKIIWPPLDELKKLVWEKPTQILSKELGVSDVAIGKFCKKNKIEKPPRGYWKKVAHGQITVDTNNVLM